MPAESPRDDPLLPQLRRFRFGPGDAVPREVTARDAPTGDADGAVSDPTPAREEPQPASRPHPDDQVAVVPPVRRSPAAEPVLGSRVRTPEPPAVPRAPARRDAAARLPAVPPEARPSTTPPRRTLLVTAAAAVVVLALIGWLVLGPRDGAPEAAGRSATASPLSAGQWADGACQALASFESAAMPIRAAAVQAATNGAAQGIDVGGLRREAASLLGTLATRVAAIGSPGASSPVAPLAADLTDAVTAALAQTGGSANGSVGGPGAAASIVSQALAAPLAAFTQALDTTDETTRQEVTGISSCAGLL
ncbi:hypothetical protein [Cumulibacter manganitolerans]|uniref:hypothetical protein n=1 Tax=Cumulibacter manganitolerans TaxID=1884992 RepID=UPI001295219F|nr:hypothetical protein [Cumulibacter manganitolerans]